MRLIRPTGFNAPVARNTTMPFFSLLALPLSGIIATNGLVSTAWKTDPLRLLLMPESIKMKLHSLSLSLSLSLLFLHHSSAIDPDLDLNPAQAVDGEATPALLPVGMPDRDLMEPNNTQPARRVSMLWVQGTGKGRVKVTGRMRWPTVLLEDIGAVRGVTCEEGMVRVRFGDGDDGGGGDGDGDGDDDDDAFVRARDSWMAHPRFVLVTNALGACDAPAERGIYLANGSAVTVHLSDRRLDVPAQRIDFADAVRTSQVTVKSKRGGARRRRKRVTMDLNPTLDMSGLEVFRFENSSLVADRLRLDASLTLSGKLRLGFFSVEECWFDIRGLAALDLALDLQVDAQLQRTFEQSTPPLTLPLLAVPGIFAVGPAVQLAVGVDVTAMASLYAEAELRMEFVDASWHVDLVDGSRSQSVGMTPVCDVAVRLGGKASLHFDPFVDVRFLLNVRLLSGLLNLNGGIKVVPKLVNAFALDDGHWMSEEKPEAAIDTTHVQPPPLISIVLLDQGKEGEEKDGEPSARYKYDVVDGWQSGGPPRLQYPQSDKSKKRKGKKKRGHQQDKPFDVWQRSNAKSLSVRSTAGGRGKSIVDETDATTEVETVEKSPEQLAAERKAKEGRRKSNEAAAACRDGISLKSEIRLDVIAVLAKWEWNLYRRSAPFFDGCYALPTGASSEGLRLLGPPRCVVMLRRRTREEKIIDARPEGSSAWGRSCPLHARGAAAGKLSETQRDFCRNRKVT
ncbi:hypothetical protein L249_5267 [Ophiocordyceps polyrhachis-furcata BCC 54312]|uniref:DUF7029 domain-containing protein n=1 Tax=Ophiocordyceps polyrhachis-furcata BCC 54312 TaxID=1330021 RepID=A0A367L8U5_9HYPO|nr:hypothetical protein L249_5267 [Ophiocordyceps polyrhachis-furcata BCC 54312]